VVLHLTPVMGKKLIPGCEQSAHTHKPGSIWCCYFLLSIWLLSQTQTITALWPVANYCLVTKAHVRTTCTVITPLYEMLGLAQQSCCPSPDPNSAHCMFFRNLFLFPSLFIGRQSEGSLI